MKINVERRYVNGNVTSNNKPVKAQCSACAAPEKRVLRDCHKVRPVYGNNVSNAQHLSVSACSLLLCFSSQKILL